MGVGGGGVGGGGFCGVFLDTGINEVISPLLPFSGAPWRIETWLRSWMNSSEPSLDAL